MALEFPNIIVAAGFVRFVQSVPTLDYDAVLENCDIRPISTGLLAVDLPADDQMRYENCAIMVTPEPENGSAVIVGGAVASANGGFADLVFHDTAVGTRANPLSFSFVIYRIVNADTDPVLKTA